MIGSGATPGMLGIRPGIGDIGRVGGMHIDAGLAIGIGVIVTLTIVAIIIAHSVMDANRVEAIRSYAAA